MLSACQGHTPPCTLGLKCNAFSLHWSEPMCGSGYTQPGQEVLSQQMFPLKTARTLWSFFKVSVTVQVAEGYKATNGLRNSQVKEASIPFYIRGLCGTEMRKRNGLPGAAHGDQAHGS